MLILMIRCGWSSTKCGTRWGSLRPSGGWRFTAAPYGLSTHSRLECPRSCRCNRGGGCRRDLAAQRTMPSLMFTGRYGIPIDPRTLNRKLAARCDAAGVRRLTVHKRLAYMCHAARRPRCASARDHASLRHADQAVTMEIYANASSAATRSAAATWRHLALMCCCTLDEAWAVGELQ